MSGNDHKQAVASLLGVSMRSVVKQPSMCEQTVIMVEGEAQQIVFINSNKSEGLGEKQKMSKVETVATSITQLAELGEQRSDYLFPRTGVRRSRREVEQ